MVDEQELELAELLAEVRRIEVQSRRLVTEVMSGGYSSVFRGAGIEFAEVREYVEGDDPRTVDWGVTARLGRPYVRRYVDEREQTVLFLLDLSASMTGGCSRWSARQMAARICACLSLSALRNNDKVGLIAFDREVRRYVPAKKGAGHVLRIVRDCLALSAGPAGTDLAPALEFAGRVVRRRATLFLVSDFLAAGWEDAMARCARRHDLVAVRIEVPELEPLPRGLLRVRDPETGAARWLDFADPRLRAAQQSRVADWRRRGAEALRRASVDLMPVPVPRERDPQAVAGPILRFFRMRQLRGAKR